MLQPTSINRTSLHAADDSTATVQQVNVILVNGVIVVTANRLHIGQGVSRCADFGHPCSARVAENNTCCNSLLGPLYPN